MFTGPESFWLWVAAIFVATGSLFAQTAEGPIAAVQRSLKEQQFYFGEVTGQIDEETRAALRRFQIHRGIPVSSEPDAATLQALQSATSQTTAEPETGEDRSVRGRAQRMVQDDREFLEQMEPSGEAYTAGPPPVRPDVEQTPPTPPAAERKNRPQPEKFRGPAEPRRRPDLEPLSITPNEARGFVEEYLDAAERESPEREVSFYSDRVDYFDSGRVNRKFIEKDQRNYYKRWPSRQFELIGQPEIVKATKEDAIIRFKVRYSLEGKKGATKGKTEEVMRLKRDGDGWKIGGIRERKLSD